MRFLRIFVMPVLAAVIAIPALFASAPAANAATSYGCTGYTVWGCFNVNANQVNIHEDWGNFGTIVGQAQAGQEFSIHEIRCTSSAQGDVNGDHVWIYGTDQTTGVTGLISDYYIGYGVDAHIGSYLWYQIKGAYCYQTGPGTYTWT